MVEERWCGNFLEMIVEILEVVEFFKCELINRKVWKFGSKIKWSGKFLVRNF